MTNVFAANLPYAIDDEQLASAFAEYGRVESAEVIRDRDSGASRGFGFVLMSREADAQAAIASLNGQTWDGGILQVNVAKHNPNRRL